MYTTQASGCLQKKMPKTRCDLFFWNIKFTGKASIAVFYIVLK